MLRTTLLLLFVVAQFLPLSVSGQIPGDINGDGIVDQSDVVALENNLTQSSSYYDIRADVDGLGNGDGVSGNGVVDAYDLFRLKRCLASTGHCAALSDWDERLPVREFTLDMRCTTPPTTCAASPSNPDCGRCPVAVTTYNVSPYTEDYKFKNITLTETTNNNKVWKVDYERKGYTTVNCGFPSLNFTFSKSAGKSQMFPAMTSLDLTQPYFYRHDHKSRVAYYRKVRLQTPCSPTVTGSTLENPAWESLFRQYLMAVIYRSMGVVTYDVIGFGQINSYSNLMAFDQARVPPYHHFLLEQRIGEEDDLNPFFSSVETVPGALYNQFSMAEHADARTGGVVPTGNDWYQFNQSLTSGGSTSIVTRYLEPTYSIRYHLLYEFGYDYDKALGQDNLDVAHDITPLPWIAEPTARPWKLLPNDFDLSMRPTAALSTIDPPRLVAYTCCNGPQPTIPTAERASWLASYYTTAREIFINPQRYLELLDAVDQYPFYFPKCFDSQDPTQIGSVSGCSSDNPGSLRYGYYEAQKRTAKNYLRNRFLYFALYFSSARFAEETGTPVDHILDANEEFFLQETKRYVAQLPSINASYWNPPAPSFEQLVTELDALPRPTPTPTTTPTARPTSTPRPIPNAPTNLRVKDSP